MLELVLRVRHHFLKNMFALVVLFSMTLIQDHGQPTISCQGRGLMIVLCQNGTSCVNRMNKNNIRPCIRWQIYIPVCSAFSLDADFSEFGSERQQLSQSWNDDWFDSSSFFMSHVWNEQWATVNFFMTKARSSEK